MNTPSYSTSHAAGVQFPVPFLWTAVMRGILFVLLILAGIAFNVAASVMTGVAIAWVL